MLVLGIDLASQANRTAACLLEWTDSAGRVVEVRQPVDDDLALEIARDASLASRMLGG